jgi:predicted nucleotidyltransferase component of viral defense system
LISRLEIRQKAAEWGLRLDVVEKDYVLSWVLWGLFQQPELARTLAFKGGTALRKMYFPAYRFSEDLDFTITAPLGKDELEAALREAVRGTQEASGLRLDVAVLRQTRDEEGGEAYEGRIEYTGPMQRRGPNLPRVKLDLTAYELVLMPPQPRRLINAYSERIEASIPTYALEEVLAEKLRSLLRRTRARDVYDIWFLLKHHQDALDMPAAARLFEKKRAFKGIALTGRAGLWTEDLKAGITASWQQSLAYQIRDLPPFDEVAAELPRLLKAVLLK